MKLPIKYATGSKELPKGMGMGVLLEALTDVPTPRTTPVSDPCLEAERIAHLAALQAGCVSGSAAMISGPLGLFSIAPEMLLVLRIQRQMVADVAGLHGATVDLSPDVMVYCLFKHTAAHLLQDVVVRTGGKWLVRRASARATTNLLRRVGIKLTQRAFSKGVSRFVPLLGAGAMAAYARSDTLRVAGTTMELFTHEIAHEER